MRLQTKLKKKPVQTRISTLPQSGILQRRSLREDANLKAPPIVHDVLRSPGRPLDSDTRTSMESHFGHNFGQMRVHTDAKATESARAVNAQAFTVGHNVVFATGRYKPGTNKGQRLLAHELAHVVQQKAVVAQAPRDISKPGDRYEQEAERVGDSLLDGLRIGGLSNQQKPILSRQGPVEMHHAVEFIKRENKRRRKKAMTLAKSLEKKYPGWFNVLPKCPCKVENARKSSVWVEDGFLKRLLILPFFHPGAATAFRSTKGYASKPGTSHGQQCTYDDLGDLITMGPSAGTPDVWSPVTHFSKHQDVDVDPFNILGWKIYNQYWKPNKGLNCSENKGKKKSIFEAIQGGAMSVTGV